MQLFSQYTVGIDIKQDSAAIVALRSGAKGYKLAGHEIFVLDPDLSIVEQIGRLGRLVNNLFEELKLYAPNVLVSIPGDKTIIRELSFPLSVKENLQETMRYEVEKYVPFAASDIYFDCQVTDVDKKNSTIKVLLVAVKKDDLDPYLALQTEIGAMSSLETASTVLAFGLGVESGGQWQDGTGMFVTLESGRVQCHAIKGQRLLASHILPFDNDSQDQTAMLHESIDSFCSRHSSLSSNGAIFFLEDENNRQLTVSLAEKMNLKPLPLPNMLPSANLLTAYYLALKGQRRPDGLINILPENLRRSPSRASMYVTVALSVLICFLSLGLAGNILMQKRMIERQMTNEVARLNRELDGLSHLQDEVALAKDRIEYFVVTGQQKTVALDILNELSQLLPDSVWIDKCDYSKNRVRIDGSAESASALIERLEESYLFKDVSFFTQLRKDKNNRELFSIGFSINSNKK